MLHSAIFQLCVALLLRNYICSLKSGLNTDVGHVHGPRSISVHRGEGAPIQRNDSMVDDVAPRANLQHAQKNKSHNHTAMEMDVSNPSLSTNQTSNHADVQNHSTSNRRFDGLDMSSGTGDRVLTARQRKNFCMLAIKLIQGADLPFQDLARMLYPSAEVSDHKTTQIDLLSTESHHQKRPVFGAISYLLFEEWKRDMANIVAEGVGGLMDLSTSLEKMISPEKRLQEEQHIPILHRASVVGLFLRRVILCFDKLNFSEVSHLYHNFKSYYQQGMSAFPCNQKSHSIIQPTQQSRPNETTLNVSSPDCAILDLDTSSFSAEVANINQNELLGNGMSSSVKENIGLCAQSNNEENQWRMEMDKDEKLFEGYIFILNYSHSIIVYNSIIIIGLNKYL